MDGTRANTHNLANLGRSTLLDAVKHDTRCEGKSHEGKALLRQVPGSIAKLIPYGMEQINRERRRDIALKHDIPGTTN